MLHYAKETLDCFFCILYIFIGIRLPASVSVEVTAGPRARHNADVRAPVKVTLSVHPV